MSFAVNFEEVKNAVFEGWATAQTEAPKWLDRFVTVIKAGRDMASPLLREKSVAVIALMISTFVLCKMVSFLTSAFARVFLCKGQDSLANKGKAVLDWTISGALLVAAVVAAARFFNLPLTPAEITGCSAISAAAYSLIY